MGLTCVCADARVRCILHDLLLKLSFRGHISTTTRARARARVCVCCDLLLKVAGVMV